MRPRRAFAPPRPAGRLVPLAAGRLAAGGLAVAALTGCGSRGDDRTLDRDLTLASASARPAIDSSVRLGGDTASGRPAPPAALPPAADPTAPKAPGRTAAPAPRAERPPTAPQPVERSAARAPDRVAARPTPTRPVDTADGETAPTPSPAAAPTLAGAVAATPAPGAAVGPAPGPARGLAAGTLLASTLSQRVCTESSRPGDRFVATLGGPVTGADGAALPAGTAVVLELTRAGGDPPIAEFLVRGVSVAGEFRPVTADAAPVTGQTERREVVDQPGNAAGTATKGAVVGAILGSVLGGRGRGTVIGAAGGAAAGAVMGRARTHQETCLSAGAPVRVRLTETLALP